MDSLPSTSDLMQLGSFLSLRSFLRLGLLLLVYGITTMESILFTLDFLNVEFAPSSHSLIRLGSLLLLYGVA